MQWRRMTPERRRRVGTIAILIAGLGAAVVVFLTAQPPPENPFGDPLLTKKYLHDLEVYGGKANVAAAEFMEWFNSLWHGERLAYTLAALTLIATWLFRFFTRPLPPDLETRPPIRLVHSGAGRSGEESRRQDRG